MVEDTIQIHTLLNRGESVHQLQRAIYSGKVAPERGRRRDEMRAISGSHALLTNIVLAWNTGRMHEVIEKLKRDGTRIDDDWLRRIGPAPRTSTFEAPCGSASKSMPTPCCSASKSPQRGLDR